MNLRQNLMNWYGNTFGPKKAQASGPVLGPPEPPKMTPATPILQQGQRYNLSDPKSPIGQQISGKAAYYGIAPRLLAAVLQTESGGNPYATIEKSPADTSYGLAQVSVPRLGDMRINPSREYQYNPNNSITAGAKAIQETVGRIKKLGLAGVKNEGFTGVPEEDAARIYFKYNRGLYAGYGKELEDERVARFREIYAQMKERYK